LNTYFVLFLNELCAEPALASVVNHIRANLYWFVYRFFSQSRSITRPALNWSIEAWPIPVHGKRA